MDSRQGRPGSEGADRSGSEGPEFISSEEPRLSQRLRWGLLIAGLICSGAIAAIIVWVSGHAPADLYETLSALHLKWLVSAVGISALVWATRAARLWILFPQLTARDALDICATHNALTRLLPARTGELSLPMALNRRGDVPLSEGALTMLWLRLIEVACLGVIISLALSLWLAPQLISPQVALVLTVIATLCAWSARPLLSWTLSLLGRRVPRLHALLGDLASQRQMSGLKLVSASALTALILAEQALLFALILWASGADLSYLYALVGSGAVHLSGVLPAPTIGNVGTHEVGWVLSYTQLGVSAPIATLSALISQWLTLALALTWWGVIRVIRGDKRSRLSLSER